MPSLNSAPDFWVAEQARAQEPLLMCPRARWPWLHPGVTGAVLVIPCPVQMSSSQQRALQNQCQGSRCSAPTAGQSCPAELSTRPHSGQSGQRRSSPTPCQVAPQGWSQRAWGGFWQGWFQSSPGGRHGAGAERKTQLSPAVSSGHEPGCLGRGGRGRAGAEPSVHLLPSGWLSSPASLLRPCAPRSQPLPGAKPLPVSTAGRSGCLCTLALLQCELH